MRRCPKTKKAPEGLRYPSGAENVYRNQNRNSATVAQKFVTRAGAGAGQRGEARAPPWHRRSEGSSTRGRLPPHGTPRSRRHGRVVLRQWRQLAPVRPRIPPCSGDDDSGTAARAFLDPVGPRRPADLHEDIPRHSVAADVDVTTQARDISAVPPVPLNHHRATVPPHGQADCPASYARSPTGTRFRRQPATQPSERRGSAAEQRHQNLRRQQTPDSGDSDRPRLLESQLQFQPVAGVAEVIAAPVRAEGTAPSWRICAIVGTQRSHAGHTRSVDEDQRCRARVSGHSPQP